VQSAECRVPEFCTLHFALCTSVRRPAVSVCIVNWNCRELLRDCLRSLTPRRQGVPLEVIVVDNCSADGTADMVERDFPHVRLVRNQVNLGFACACNQAARLARGRFLFFLNNDTRVGARALRRLVEHARGHPEVGLLGPRLVDARGRTQASARRRPTVAALLHRLVLLRWTGLFRAAYRRYRGRDHARGGPVEVLMGAALLMPRRLFRALGGWDEGYTFGGEDIDLCARVARSHQVVYHPDALVLHLGRASSRQHPGFAHSNTLIGITRSLRRTGTPGWLLAVYKLLFTLDLPLQGLLAAGRYLVSRLRGRPRRAARAWLDLRGLAYFARYGLARFWRA
jgi:GT2 family glycosyltransferase